MLMSLFDIFDPFVYSLDFNFKWVEGLIFVVLMFCSNYWSISGSVLGFFRLLIIFMKKEAYSLFNHKVMLVTILISCSLFLFIVFTNLHGLIPYTFSYSSHPDYGLSLSYPTWVSLFLMGWVLFSQISFAHLIPSGTPLALIPLMIFVELISSIIRPLALAVRLMANMIAGHLLMSLLGMSGFAVYLGELGLMLFEMFVCLIQAFVFSILMILYATELD